MTDRLSDERKADQPETGEGLGDVNKAIVELGYLYNAALAGEYESIETLRQYHKSVRSVLVILQERLYYSPPPQGNAEDMRYVAAGWMHAECCSALDRGDDPRTMDVAAMKERMDRALAAHAEPRADVEEALAALGRLIVDALNTYSVTEQIGEDDEPLNLADILTPDGQALGAGMREVQALADHLFNEIEPSVRALHASRGVPGHIQSSANSWDRVWERLKDHPIIRQVAKEHVQSGNYSAPSILIDAFERIAEADGEGTNAQAD